MDWNEVREIALRLHGVSGDSILRVEDQPIARMVDATTVAFALDDATDRDALIAAAPTIFSITPKFAGLPIVLASLPALDANTARERLEAAWNDAATPALRAAAKAAVAMPKPVEVKPAAKVPAKKDSDAPVAAATGPRLSALVFITEDGPERRKFFKLGRGCVIDWLLAVWRTPAADRSWGKLPEPVHQGIVRELEKLDERGLSPQDPDARDTIAHELGCADHIFSIGDYFDGVAWELMLLDEDYMKLDASDYLPHPGRGETKKNVDDGYRELLKLHKKHRRTWRE